jgi:hypothetical protein
MLIFDFDLEILEFETNLWDSLDAFEEEENSSPINNNKNDDIPVEPKDQSVIDDGAFTHAGTPDPRSCSHLIVFFRALLELCPTLKRVHVTLLSETDAVRFVVYIGELRRVVASATCLHIENLFFLGHHAVITDRKPTTT